MATTIDPARLYAILMNTGLQNKDQPLYQVIHDLIATLVSVNTQVTTLLSTIASSPSISPSSGSSKIMQTIPFFDDNSSDDFFFPPSSSNSNSSSILDDNSTNANMYPVWVNATPGNQQLETSSTELIWNPNFGSFGFNVIPPDNEYRVIIKAVAAGSISALSLRMNLGSAPGVFDSRVMSIVNEGFSQQFFTINLSSTAVQVKSGVAGVNLGLDLATIGAAPLTLSTAATIRWTLYPTGGFSNTGVDPSATNVAVAGNLAVKGLITGNLPVQGLINWDNDVDDWPNFTPIIQNFTGIITDNQNNIAVTSTDGMAVKNETPSTAGVPIQQSPRLRFRSHVWNTTTPADNTSDFWWESVPISAAAPRGLMQLGTSQNGAAATFPFSVTDQGILTSANELNSTSGGLTINQGGQITWGARGRINTPADAQFNFVNHAITIGVGFDVSTTALLKIRTLAQTGDGSLSALNITTSGTLIDKSYNIAAPVTLGTVVMSAGQQRQIINPAGTLAVLTVTLPSSPTDGQIAGISFTQAITALTINAPGGATVIAPLTAAAIDTNIRFVYQASSTSWFPAA